MARRLDEILATDYLAGVEGWDTARLRAERAACEAEEEAVSYARRILQGRLDILRAELLRRRAAGSGAAAGVLAALPDILTDARAAGTAGPGSVRATRLRVPTQASDFESRIDAVVDEAALVDIAGQDVDSLEHVVTQLAGLEQELSALRRALFERIDALRDELAARYKDGRASVRDLLVEPPT